MTHRDPDRAGGLSPAQVADALPSRPILSTSFGLRDRVVLQRFKHPPSFIDLAPVRDHIVVVNLSGPTLIEQPLQDGRTLRKWTDAGHMSLTPAGASVRRRLNGRPDVLLLHIAPGLVDEVEYDIFGKVPEPGRISPQVAVADEQLNRLGHLLLSEAENEAAPGSQDVAAFLVKSLIIQLLRHYKHEILPEKIARNASCDVRIARVLVFMREHLADKITADQLAQLCGTSRSTFSRLFREVVGQSAYQHLTSVRLEHAVQLLERTDRSVTEIAFDCGFNQSTNFATVFAERFGVSPRVWRATNSAVEPTTLVRESFERDRR